MTRLHIQNALTLIGATAARHDIVVERDVIAAILPPNTSTEAPVFDGSNHLVTPGLVNSHTHSHGALAKGAGDRLSLELLLNAGPWTGGGRTDEDRYVSAALNAVELLRRGCTACCDLALQLPHPTESGLHAVAQAYADVGIRAVIAPMIADRTFWQAIPGLADGLPDDLRALVDSMQAADAETTLANIEAAARAWPFPQDRIRLGIAPTIPHHCTDGFLCGCNALSERHGLPLQTHLAESRHQRTAALRRYGHDLVTQLEKLGLLTPRFSAAHGVWLDNHDLDRIARAGGGIAHNPGSNLRLGNGVADIRPMLDRGIPVGVGTDGSASSDHQNMFEATRLAAHVSRIMSREPDQWVSAPEALHAATQGGAAILGWSRAVGRIAPGYKADLVFLRLDSPSLVPLNDPLAQLVHTEDGSSVQHVMVGGAWALKDGVVLGIDWPKLAARAQAAATRLRGVNAPARALSERLAPHVAQFCAGLQGADLPTRRIPV